jgi:hypothetical protein
LIRVDPASDLICSASQVMRAFGVRRATEPAANLSRNVDGLA